MTDMIGPPLYVVRHHGGHGERCPGLSDGAMRRAKLHVAWETIDPIPFYCMCGCGPEKNAAWMLNFEAYEGWLVEPWPEAL